MRRHNLRPLCWAAVRVGVCLGLGCGWASGEPRPPAIEHADQRFCARVARRTLEQYLADGAMYTSGYTPRSLEGVVCDVVVTLRRGRRELGVGSSGPGPIVGTTIEATVAALRNARSSAGGMPALRSGMAPEPVAVDDSGRVLIEIEAIGAEERMNIADFDSGDGMGRDVFEPGVDGFTVRQGEASLRVRPSELATKNLTLSDTLETMRKRLGGLRETQTLWRFRARHWYQSGPGRDTVALQRGMVLVDPSEVKRSTIEGAIDALGAYLIYRQRPSGLFAYEYEPAVNGYTDRDNAVHQSGAAWALAVYARVEPSEQAARAADLAVEAQRARIEELAGIAGAAFVASADHRNKLGLTAHVLLALAAQGDGEACAADRVRLGAGMVWLQQASGEFLTAFPPARRLTGANVYPGLALLGLSARYAEEPSDGVLQVFNRALGFYGASFASKPSVRSAGWLTQPFARMAVLSNRREFARFAYRMADWLIARQLTPETERWPELHGGVTAGASVVPGIDTAVCLGAWLDALSAARRFGDVERASRYRRAADSAVRFVLQLQFRESETYFLRVVEDVLGGVRTSAADNRLRIENVQYALLGLLKYRDVVLSAEP